MVKNKELKIKVATASMDLFYGLYPLIRCAHQPGQRCSWAHTAYCNADCSHQFFQVVVDVHHVGQGVFGVVQVAVGKMRF